MFSLDFIVIGTRPLALFFFAIGLTTSSLPLETGQFILDHRLREGPKIESHHVGGDFLLL